MFLFIHSWVGYSAPGFEGRQYLLEEGEYADFTDWGGLEDRLQSIRPVLAVCTWRPFQKQKSLRLMLNKQFTAQPPHINKLCSFVLF